MDTAGDVPGQVNPIPGCSAAADSADLGTLPPAAPSVGSTQQPYTQTQTLEEHL